MRFLLIISLFMPFSSMAQMKVDSKLPFIVLIGPMLHFNIGQEKAKTSWGIEASCWFNEFDDLDDVDYKSPIPIGFDLGFDVDKNKFRLYSELQCGRGWFGAAAGPVYEWNRIEKQKYWGVQGSLWANAVIGFNARFRYINDTARFVPGTYIKVPVVGSFQIGGE